MLEATGEVLVSNLYIHDIAEMLSHQVAMLMFFRSSIVYSSAIQCIFLLIPDLILLFDPLDLLENIIHHGLLGAILDTIQMGVGFVCQGTIHLQLLIWRHQPVFGSLVYG